MYWSHASVLWEMRLTSWMLKTKIWKTEAMVRLRKSGTVIRDQGAEAMTAEAEVGVMREEAGAEATTATTEEAGVAVMKEEGATAATAMTGGEVTAASCQTEGGARYQDPGHVREVEQPVEPPSTSGTEACYHLESMCMRLSEHTITIASHTNSSR